MSAELNVCCISATRHSFNSRIAGGLMENGKDADSADPARKMLIEEIVAGQLCSWRAERENDAEACCRETTTDRDRYFQCRTGCFRTYESASQVSDSALVVGSYLIPCR
jgi:hypothetical protein